MTNLKPCKFYFCDDPTFDGFADGSTWNGFDNIWVTQKTHLEIVDYFTKTYIEAGYSGDDLTEIMESFNEIEPDDDGLYSYAYGFATSIDDDIADAPDAPDNALYAESSNTPNTLYVANLETRNFSFKAYGLTPEGALESLHEAWEKHTEQYEGADSGYITDNYDSVYIHAIRANTSFRDGEQLTGDPLPVDFIVEFGEVKPA